MDVSDAHHQSSSVRSCFLFLEHPTISTLQEHPELEVLCAVPYALKLLAESEQGLATPGIYELVVLEGWPSKVASNRPDNAYATKDLFEKHPTTPNAWRYYARLDDTPWSWSTARRPTRWPSKGPPATTRTSPRPSPSGPTSPRLGLFVVRAESISLTDQQVVSSIWPTVEQLNADMPAYAYISQDMIHTDKGTVIRPAFYRDVQRQIDQIYDLEGTSGDRILEGPELLAFLRAELLRPRPVHRPLVPPTHHRHLQPGPRQPPVHPPSAACTDPSLQARRVPSSPNILALPSSLADPHLGLDPQTYALLTRTTTAVIHCAWSVNFNWSLESFTPITLFSSYIQLVASQLAVVCQTCVQ
ncbi:hypothetical protein BO71DRAFT_488052 [Aspergillus ellipticus CBS 707.79]|uniref:Thioester reductase (TE) domain-containing protein n=1 Tax=Aspergillus ellipticus CBS 707.79 TaxID=1448320 RepID=A0A319EDZ7_9EURO|nr:hypothetical protein BO71DRAFT_488052 [Aspergillus ellipticus CBS 707.79]